MSAKSTTLCSDVLKLLLNSTAIADLAQNDTSSPLTTLYLALHSADPTPSGDQSTNEISYTGYARAAVSRTGGAWTVSAGVATANAIIAFPLCGGGSATATYASIGKLSGGAGEILYSGVLSPSISISAGVTPAVSDTSTITEQ
jgi:hypothetical protein